MSTAIAEKLTTYQGQYLVVGPPGTGKTTWLSRTIKTCVEKGQSVLACSLTKAAASELLSRDLPVPADHVGTLHAHGYRLLGHPPLITQKILDEEWNRDNPAYEITGDATDVDDPFAGGGGKGAGDEIAEQYHLYRHQMRPREAWLTPSLLDFAEKWERWKFKEGLIDFSDMIELPYRDWQQSSAPGDPQVILVDEAQDLSKLELALLQKWAKAAEALIVVGDPWQALYEWRGAHPEMFDDHDVPAERQKVLSQSYRIPRAVHAYATHWIRQLSTYKPIKYLPRDVQGEVTDCDATWKHPEYIVPLIREELANGHTVMIQASCGYILRPTISALRGNGIPFCNPWAPRRGDWSPLKRSTARTTSTVDRVLAFLRGVRTDNNDPLKRSTARTTSTVDRVQPDNDDFIFGHNVARAWTCGDVRTWAELCSIKGVFQPGALRAIKSHPAEAEFDEALVRAYFNPLHHMFLNRVRSGEVTREEAFRWLEAQLSAKKKAAYFPIEILRRDPAGLDSPPRVFVGTIHSFKGAEADCVIVFPDLSMQGYDEWDSIGKGKDSVVRQFYVAFTRAREKLVLCEQIGGLAVDFARS